MFLCWIRINAANHFIKCEVSVKLHALVNCQECLRGIHGCSMQSAPIMSKGSVCGCSGQSAPIMCKGGVYGCSWLSSTIMFKGVSMDIQDREYQDLAYTCWHEMWCAIIILEDANFLRKSSEMTLFYSVPHFLSQLEVDTSLFITDGKGHLRNSFVPPTLVCH